LGLTQWWQAWSAREAPAAPQAHRCCGESSKVVYLPKTVETGNGSDFISKVMGRKACECDVGLEFSGER
jgi:hypothetical protein